MLQFIDKMEYQELLMVEDIPENFERLCIKATAYINEKTFSRIDPLNISKNVKYATAEVINTLKENEKINLNLKSENVEGWSVTYADNPRKELENELYSILKLYLSNEVGLDGLPLLYRGVM